MLAPALRRHAGHRPLQDLQQPLLDALARHVARDGYVFHPPRHLVDLVNVHNAQLGAGDVAVRRPDQAQQDVFHVLAHVAGLGDGRGVGNAERHIQHPRQRPGQQRLAAARRTDHQDVALVDLHPVVVPIPVQARLDALVVVVDRHGQDLLDPLLADHELVQPGLDLLGPGHGQAARRRGTGRAPAPGGVRMLQHRGADVHALVADAQTVGSRNQRLDRRARPAAERAAGLGRMVFFAGHGATPSKGPRPARRPPARTSPLPPRT